MGVAVTYSHTLCRFVRVRTEGRPPGQRFVEPCRLQTKKKSALGGRFMRLEALATSLYFLHMRVGMSHRFILIRFALLP